MNLLTRKSKIAIVAVIFCLLAFFGMGATLVWAQSYEGRIAPRTRVGNVDLGGLDVEQARTALQNAADTFVTNGIEVAFENKTFRLPLSVVVGSDSIESARFDVEGAVEGAYARAHSGRAIADAVGLLRSATRETDLPMSVTVDENAVRDSVRAALPSRETLAKNPTFSIARSGNDWNVDVVDGMPGVEFDFAPFFEQLRDRVTTFDSTPVPLAINDRDPDLSSELALSLTEDVRAALGRAPFTLSYADPSKTEPRTWTLAADDVAPLLVPAREMGPTLEIDPERLDAFLGESAATIETQAKDARFVFEDGRVKEFSGSVNGLSINREELRMRLEAAIRGVSESTVDIPTTVVEPDITTAEVNDLGITEVLGIGTSSYRGSPANRIKNIRNGVSLLNGRLIAPGETFSLLSALKPFETSNGYLPELVIKGDKIQPEIGGGLCQIGTTTFRAAMNSGLPIVQRSNHSLVVSYYNDPSNGNPGTDATIYDPAPDFQFTNDTGHDILFEAEMLEDTQQLQFTFWGTNDGRKGSYSPPVVERWIGVGDPVETETLDLPVGEKKCQAAHVGADTSFTYTVVKPDGTVTDRVFASHYRPLPEICLVGVEELSTQEDLQPNADGVSSSVTADAPVDDAASQTVTQTKTE